MDGVLRSVKMYWVFIGRVVVVEKSKIVYKKINK